MHVGINVLLCGAWLGTPMVAAVVLQLEQVTGALGHDADKTLTETVAGSFAALCIFPFLWDFRSYAQTIL